MKFLPWFLIVVLVGAGIWVLVFGHRHSTTATVPAGNTAAPQASEQETAQQQIRAQILAFGGVLKDVSLLSPTAAADMQQRYAPYVTKSLLAAWAAHPDAAIGRTTSSPWPDRFDISDIESSANGTYTVRVQLIFMTSNEVENGGDAGTETVQLTMKQEDGVWKIDQTAVLAQHAPNAPLGKQDRPQLE